MNNRPDTKRFELGSGAKALAVLAMTAGLAQTSETVRDFEAKVVKEIAAIIGANRAESKVAERNKEYFVKQKAEIIQAMLAQGNFRDVIDYFKDNGGSEEQLKELYLKKGRHYEEKGNFYFAHWAYERAGETAKMRECLRQALAKMEKNNFWDGLVVAHRKLGDSEKATEYSNKAVAEAFKRAADDKVSASYWYSDAWNQLVNSGLPKDEAIKRVIAEALKNGDPKSCAEYYGELSKPDLELANSIANLAYSQNKFDLGVNLLIKAGVDEKVVYSEAGEVAVQNGKYDQASWLLEAAGKNMPDVYRGFAKELAQSNPEKAAYHYDLAGDVKTARSIYTKLARAHEKHGNYEDAARLFTSANNDKKAAEMHGKHADDLAKYNPAKAAETYELAGDKGKSEQYAKVAAKKEGDRLLGGARYFAAARQYIKSGMERVEAFTKVAKAAEKNHSFKDAADLYERVGNSGKMEENAANAAYAALDRNNFIDAARLFVRAGDIADAEQAYLKLALHHKNIAIEGLVTDCNYDENDAKLKLADIFNKKYEESEDRNVRFLWTAANLYGEGGEESKAKKMIEDILGQANSELENSERLRLLADLKALEVKTGDLDQDEASRLLSKEAKRMGMYREASAYYEGIPEDLRDAGHWRSLQFAYADNLFESGDVVMAANRYEELGDTASAQKAWIAAAHKVLSYDYRDYRDQAEEYFNHAGLDEVARKRIIAQAYEYKDPFEAAELYMEIGDHDAAIKVLMSKYKYLNTKVTRGKAQQYEYKRLVYVIDGMVDAMDAADSQTAAADVQRGVADGVAAHVPRGAVKKQLKPKMVARKPRVTTHVVGMDIG